MRAYLPSYELRRARSLEEALDLLARPNGDWQPFAGGTDLMVLFAAGTLAHQRFVNIHGLPELRRIDFADDAVTIGALTTFTDLQRDATVRTEFPLLWQAAGEIGGVANQNRATIGGNIANASPAADSPPALVVYDAELELVSATGSRRVPYSSFHTGYKRMNLAKDELITAVRLPRRRLPRVQRYRKVGARRAQAISKVCFAGALELEGDMVVDARLAFGSVAPTVVRAGAAEGELKGRGIGPEVVERAVAALAGALAPIDDLRSSARYRERVAGNLLREFLAGAAERSQGKMP